MVAMVAVLTLCGLARGDSFRERREQSQSDAASTVIYARSPPVNLRLKIYAFNTGCVISPLPHIALLFGGRHVPKVLEAVVRPHAVDVIYFVLRPNVVGQRPSDTVRQIRFLKYVAGLVPRWAVRGKRRPP
jgi:hypothetical protein